MGAVILDKNVGYVECNVCGSGYNHILVKVFSNDKYELTRTSKCYGNQTYSDLTKLELLATLDEHNYLVATRLARNAVRTFKRQLKSGKLTWKMVNQEDPEPTVWFDEATTITAQPTTVTSNTSTITWEGASIWTTASSTPTVTPPSAGVVRQTMTGFTQAMNDFSNSFTAINPSFARTLTACNCDDCMRSSAEWLAEHPEDADEPIQYSLLDEEVNSLLHPTPDEEYPVDEEYPF